MSSKCPFLAEMEKQVRLTQARYDDDLGAVHTGGADPLEVARVAADVVVLGGTLAQIPHLFAVSRQAAVLSRRNFGIALAYDAVAIPIAVLRYATPLMAALAMSLSSITVLLNAIRVGRGA